MIQQMFHVEWGIDIEKKGDSQPLFEQVHGDQILHFREPPIEKEVLSPLCPADGAVAYFSKAELHVYTADCFPILFFTEEATGPVAAIHAGWKGLKKGIVQKACNELSMHPTLHAIVGPAIGECCFAVREDFIEDWKNAGLTPQKYLTSRGNRYYFNLLKYVTQEALAPLSATNIHLQWHRCTACSSPALPSFRRNKSANPRLKTWIKKLV